MPRKGIPTLFLVGLAALCPLSGVQANSIGLNFVDGRHESGSNALSASSTAGIVPQANWNNTSANIFVDGTLPTLDTSSVTSPTAGRLVDDTGADSGATVSWSGHTTWSTYNDAPNSNNDDWLMSDYLLTEANTGIDATVNFDGIPYNNYDVYVYFGSTDPISNNLGTITLNGGSAVSVEDLEFTNGPFVEATGNGAAGHYVRFSGVRGSSMSVALDATPGPRNFHLGIFGIQIVETTPDPLSGLQFTDIQILPSGFVQLTWRSEPEKTYTLFWSTDGVDFSGDVSDNILSGGTETTVVVNDADAPVLTAPTLLFKARENN